MAKTPEELIEEGKRKLAEAMEQAAEMERLNKLRKESGELLEKELEKLNELIEAQKILNDQNEAATINARESMEESIRLEQEYQRIKSTDVYWNLSQDERDKEKKDREEAVKKAEEDQQIMLAYAKQRIDNLKEIKGITEELKEIDPKIQFGSPDNIEKFGENIEKFEQDMIDAEAAGLDLAGALEVVASKGGFIGNLIRDFQGFVKLAKMMGSKLKFLNKDLSQVLEGAANSGGMVKLAGQRAKTMVGSIGNLVKSIGGIAVVAVAAMLSLTAVLFKVATDAVAVSRSLGAATGFGLQFGNEITKIYGNVRAGGGSMQEAGEAITALANNFSAFSPAAAETNISLATSIVRLTKIGVAADASAKTMDYFHRVMGMTAEQSADMTVKLATMGREMGVTSSKMISDFGAAQSRLAVFGDRGTKVFKGLAAAAKATGLEINTLIGFAKQFDQFDTAAESSAKLNAVLGTQISTLDLLNMEDDERIRYLTEQINLSVGNFDSLDKYTKMYVAQAMGLSSVEEAQRMLNMTQAEYAANQKSMEEAAATQAELARMTAELLPFIQRLKVAFMGMIMMFQPVIELFVWAMEGLAKVASVFTFIWEYIGPFVTNLIKGLIMVSLAIVGIVVAIVASKIGIVIAAVVGAIYALVSGLTWLYRAFTLQGSPMLYEMFDYIASAAARMGNALMAPIRGIKKLGSAFLDFFGITHKKGSPELYKIPETIGKGFESMGEKASNAGLGGLEKIISFATEFNPAALLTGVVAVKSAVAELSNAVVDGGFIAIKTDGTATSMVAGSEDVIAKMADGKITVDVSMPEMKTPQIELHVQIEGQALRAIIVDEIEKEAKRRL